MKKITLKDIAEVTGLSINSVSRALKDKDSISLETRKMVQQVAKDMGYIPNSLASSMRSGRTDSIAIILGEMVNPYNAYLMNHLTTHLHDRGYTTLMFVTNQRVPDVPFLILCPPRSSVTVPFCNLAHCSPVAVTSV